MLGHGAIGQFAIGQVGAGSVEFISADKWFEYLSDPVRVKLGLWAGNQQFAFFPDPFPFVTFSYFAELSKPSVLSKRGLATQQQPYFTFHPAPSPFVAYGWRQWLSEPVRLKPGLSVTLQPAFTSDSRWILELPQFYRWFNWFSEPVRFKQGLSVTLQQTLAYHPRILPKPNITATLSAFELNNDAATLAIYVIQSQPAVSAKVSIVETGGGNSATSIWER